MRVTESSFWNCPNCKGSLEKPADYDPASAKVVECSICGAKFRPAEIVSEQPSIVAAPAAVNQASGRNPLALVVVAIIAAAMLYFGFHMARRNGSSSPTPSFAGKNSVAPDFSLESLDGKSLKLSDFRGKAVLLNFWATWCGPCKIEMPWFVELQNEYGPQGFQIVGVAMDDSSKEDIAKFAKEMGVNYPVLIGKESVGDAYGGVPALPESFFISRDGRILDKFIGLRGRAEVEDAVKATLDATPGSNAADTATAPATQQAQQ